MALADRRPLGLPVPTNTALPSFNPKTLNVQAGNSRTIAKKPAGDKELVGNLHEKQIQNQTLSDIKPLTPEESTSPIELSPTLRSISPDSLVNADLNRKLDSTSIGTSSSTSITSASSRGSSPVINAGTASQFVGKKPKPTSRVPIATGISTKIPVTGEKPRPSQKNDPSLEDDVLYAIFLILYENDADGNGMTVKQICDILVEQHPEMANLSTKTSNLVSAKLNAYVKRVEKGDSTLKYALSRDWADASPKRMVYVYRGLLAEDFHLHVKNVMEVQKQQQGHMPQRQDESHEADSSMEYAKQENLLKPRRQTMFDLGVTKNTFLDGPLEKANLFVPYSSAPVTASLTEANTEEKKHLNSIPESDIDLEDLEAFHDNVDEDEDNVFDYQGSEIDIVKKNGKRSKSLSYLPVNKKNKILTAAAAAPRAPRTPCSHSPNAAAAAAALHAAALKAISSSSSQESEYNTDGNNSDMSPESESCTGTKNSSKCKPCLHNKKWLNVVRSGFLTQDIGTPEDLSLSDLDKLFA